MSMDQPPTPNFVEQLEDDPWIEMEWRRGLFGKTREESARRDGGDGGRYNYRLRPEQRVKNARKVPQAVVKIIPGGGCSGRGQLVAQLNYLSRDGDLELEEGYREFRNPIWDTDDIRDTATRWAMDWEDAMSRDARTARAKSKTFHMLISYPEGTDPETAKEAADKFADRLCHSGEFGDEWRNVRAWHTDRAHPHMHLVVDRLGESGRMMQIHPAKEINPKRLRALQVDTAAEYGLALNDTPRVSRGHRELGLSSPEHRLEERGHRMDRSYSRQQYAMVVEGYAELSINREIRELKTLAQEYHEKHPVSRHLDAVALEDAAETLVRGGTLTGPSLLEVEREELQQEQENPRFGSRSVQEIERELMGVEPEQSAPTPQAEHKVKMAIKREAVQGFRVWTAEELERELFGVDDKPEPKPERKEPEPSIWDRLDQIGRESHSAPEPFNNRNSHFENQIPLTEKWEFSRSRNVQLSEREARKNPPEHAEEKLSQADFFAKIYEGEKDIWANDRKHVAKLLDEIEAQQVREVDFKPDVEQFFDQIDSRIIQLTKEEKERARDLGIDNGRTRDQDFGLSFGF